ncbi:MAG TPA: hypothetical protein VHV78_07185 [Gemmatimonadaceae bacterium]|jgi:hypothetical protein|nr:hypothetical protein [Gemmatimonadaceae bacterium]
MQDNGFEHAQQAVGIEEWLDLVEDVLQGLHHGLNNRIGSLSALVELYQLDAGAPDAPTLASMSADIARLEECSRVARLLPRAPAVGEEPLTLEDVFADAFAIHRFLHDTRDVRVAIAPARYTEPVRVERSALVHALTLILNDAKRLAKATGSVVRSSMESDEQWVRVELQIGTPLVADVPRPLKTDYADRLAETFGGVVHRKPGVVELKLPTLKARRAADRR